VFDEARIFIAELAGGELGTMVGQAWDLGAIEQSYEEFLAEFASARTDDPLVRLVDLVHAWRRFPWIDPTLPRQLLPAHWSGTKAVTLFQRRHARWAADAMAEWVELNRPAG
jgi:phenylacetic acid degradation operon negative regulatory protein